MAHARRSPQHRAPSSSISNSPTPRRTNHKRAPSRQNPAAAAQSISSPVHRPVLVPLQPNLRRLPSRLVSQNSKDSDYLMRDSGHVIQVGSKRKRVASANENTLTHGRSTRRLKRQRPDAGRGFYPASSEESESDLSSMDIDGPPARWALGHGSEEEEEISEEERDSEDASGDEERDSSDEHLIHFATQRELVRRLKPDLMRLYHVAGLPDDPELLTKHELAEAIILARDEVASVPPSSPSRGDGATTDESCDEGNVAGGEETDACSPHKPAVTTPLRRRVTLDDVTKASRPQASRSFSLGNPTGLGQRPNGLKRKASVRLDIAGPEQPRHRVSTRSSPTTSHSNTQSPPHTRLRTRQVSQTHPVTPISTKGKSKARSKQVEFSNDVDVHKSRSSKGKEPSTTFDSESDLTELEDLERSLLSNPSPRRLRSKDRDPDRRKSQENGEGGTRKQSMHIQEEGHTSDEIESRPLRRTPKRKAKAKIGSLKESDTEAEHDNEEGLGETDEEDEVDELVSHTSASPSPESKKKRPAQTKRSGRRSLPTGEDENEGDDEEEEDIEASEDGEGDEDQEDEEGSVEQDVDEDDEATIAVEPRRLRNGKIVGEDDEVHMEVDGDAEEEEEDGEASESVESVQGDETGEEDVAAADDNEVMDDDDVDLTVATAKTLVRLRRDDLVRLCEQRDLEPVGTKPQLAEALLLWRDRHANDFSSPSSTGTVRPASQRRRRRGKQSSASTITTDTPVLLRSEQIHTDEPRTPIRSKDREKEEELELDLESLGLEDREIAPEKLTKLEKIGSGGFKDVFIGKFRGRRIAISEFRGQLSQMDIKELKLLGAFNHPNIVRFLGVSIPENTKETPVMIVSELCSNGDLFDYVRNVNAPPLRKVLHMMLDIARGLEYLHTRKPSVIHRDCKSSNILITAKGTAKIADFGLAKVKQSTRSMVRSLVGTVNWQAPELWHAHPKYNHKVDVFSCAMVFWEMLQWHLPNKKFPWEGMNEHAIYDIVGAKRQRPSVSGLRKQWCPEIVELIERMWEQEHQARPNMTEVVQTLEELMEKYR